MNVDNPFKKHDLKRKRTGKGYRVTDICFLPTMYHYLSFLFVELFIYFCLTNNLVSKKDSESYMTARTIYVSCSLLYSQ